jgi:BirA family biotin operon repressor/biotin-[acetyl-CoA-carboxylase] ligase
MDEATVKKIDKLVELMADHAMVVVSGEKIARELGVTRSSVWNWIERLRAFGCEIEGVQSTGYRLKKHADLLTPQLIRRELGSSIFGKTLHHFLEIGSTNDYASELAMRGSPEGTVVLAEEQKAGRGRSGHGWHSEPLKGIYCSVILRPSLAPAKAPLLTLAAALAIYDAVYHMSPLKMDIRWPNDLLINGKKFCGILTEMNAEVSRVRYVVVGIGVNVNHTAFPKEIGHLATSLRMETGRIWSRIELTAQILRRLEVLCREMETHGGQGIIRRWSEISTYAKDKHVEIVEGENSFRGETMGLDENGFLRVRREDGKSETVYSGNVLDVN